MNVTIYNITITGINDYFSLLNEITLGTFGVGILFMLAFVGIFYLSRTFNIYVSIFLTLALLLPVSIALVTLNALNNNALLVHFVLLFIFAIISYLNKPEY